MICEQGFKEGKNRYYEGSLKHVKRAPLAVVAYIRMGDCNVPSCLGWHQYIKENYEEFRRMSIWRETYYSFSFIKAAKEIRHEVPDHMICLLLAAVVMIKNVSSFQALLNMQKGRPA